MSETPRTDAEALKSRPPFALVTRKYAEQLERELNAANAELERERMEAERAMQKCTMKTENDCRCDKRIKQLEEAWNKACDEQGLLMLECDGHRAKAAKLREALQSVMDWNPKPEYWERPQTVARFEADMVKAREVLEETK